MDENIFLTNSEITILIEEYWKNSTLKDSIKNLFEIRDTLLYNKRKNDIQNIFYINREIIKELKNNLIQFHFGREDNELICTCNEIQTREPKIANSKFIDLIQKIYFNENCLLNQISSPNFNEKLALIQELKEGKYIKDIVPEELKENKKEITYIGHRAESSIKKLKRKKEDMSEYIKLTDIVSIN